MVVLYFCLQNSVNERHLWNVHKVPSFDALWQILRFSYCSSKSKSVTKQLFGSHAMWKWFKSLISQISNTTQQKDRLDRWPFYLVRRLSATLWMNSNVLAFLRHVIKEINSSCPRRADIPLVNATWTGCLFFTGGFKRMRRLAKKGPKTVHTCGTNNYLPDNSSSWWWFKNYVTFVLKRRRRVITAHTSLFTELVTT